MSLTSGLIPRELVQSVPSVTPQEFVGTVANGATRNIDFDALKEVADPALLGAGGAPGGINPLVAIGPYLDAFLFTDQIMQLNVFFAISGGGFRQVSTSNIPLNTFGNISGLR